MFGLLDGFKADPDDFVIVIMGPTGSGKTNFINSLTGRAEQHRAGGLASDTQDVTPHPFKYHGLRFVLVDTPGFDDTKRQDSEILRAIADWLVQKYPDGTTLKIAGVVYLHRITDNRMSGSALMNLQMFGRLCGNISLRRTCLVTTMWDSAKDKTMAARRENELIHDFWGKLIAEGATTKRFDNTFNSALDIIQGLVNMGKGELLLQEELVAQQKRLNETEAGKMLHSRLQKLLIAQKQMVQVLAQEASLQNDAALARSLQDEYNKINAQLQKTFEEMKETEMSFIRRIITSWPFGGKSKAKPVDVGYLGA